MSTNENPTKPQQAPELANGNLLRLTEPERTGSVFTKPTQTAPAEPSRGEPSRSDGAPPFLRSDGQGLELGGRSSQKASDDR